MMRDYRLWAGLAAALIALAGVLSVTAGGTPPLPPPIAVRGLASTDPPSPLPGGLEFVPATVAEMVPVTTAERSSESGSDDTTDAPGTVPADAPDASAAPSADSPDAGAPPEVNSPDSPDSPDSADSPDD